MDHPSAAIAFIDVDHTLTRHSTGLRFAIDLIAAGFMAPRSLFPVPPLYLWYRFFPVTKRSQVPAKTKTESDAATRLPIGVRILPRGIAERDIQGLAGAFFERRTRPDLYREVAELVASLKRDGWRIFLATSTFDFLVEPLVRYLGADGFIANAIDYADGVSTGYFRGGLIFGAGKLAKCREAAQAGGVELSACAFYSDSIHDLPLLEAVGTPVAVNPDWRLYRHARGRGWRCLHFEKG